MRKISLALMALALSFGAMAQSEGAKPTHKKGQQKEARHNGNKGFKNLDLSEAQKSQLKTIKEKFHNESKSLREDKSLSPTAMKEKRQTIQKDYRQQMAAVLTPEQKKQWEENRTKEKKHGHHAKGKKTAK
jgi:periplasmic protein CpxP/Spy